MAESRKRRHESSTEIAKLEYNFLKNLMSELHDISGTYFDIMPRDIYNNFIRPYNCPMFAFYDKKLVTPCCNSYSQNYLKCGYYRIEYTMIHCYKCNSVFVYRNAGNNINNCLYIKSIQAYGLENITQTIDSYFIPGFLAKLIKHHAFDVILYENLGFKKLRFLFSTLHEQN